MITKVENHGGDLVAQILQKHGVKQLFTLCGGHISPILVGCNKLGIRVIDVRHEATAVYAADAISRLSNKIGVATVTAGPGFTNTITAIKNAQLAQVPILIIGGATSLVLKNRGSLQDIDHLSLVYSMTKYSKTINRVKDIKNIINKAINKATSNVPGPVFIEIPVDVLYPETIVREWYGLKSNNKSIPFWISMYLNWNVNSIFKNKNQTHNNKINNPKNEYLNIHFKYLTKKIHNSEKPLILIGSQSTLIQKQNKALVKALKELNIPLFVSGMARGLLSENNLPIFRYERKQALKEADIVILAGVPCDFRLDYGRMINKRAIIIAINLCKKDIYLNRRPNKGIITNPGSFLILWNDYNKKSDSNQWKSWHTKLSTRNNEKWKNIKLQSKEKIKYINPLKFFIELNSHINKGDIIIGDGGDFVATASYVLKPHSLNGWLDPGVFGTLGIGAGFILAAKLTHPDSIVWAIYGDGAFGYSLMEFDTFVRHKIPVIAIIGNDGSWQQIARDQVEIFKDSISTKLRITKYHDAIKALGGEGYFIDNENQIERILIQAKQSAKLGVPTVINVRIGKTEFRKGSLSI